MAGVFLQSEERPGKLQSQNQIQDLSAFAEQHHLTKTNIPSGYVDMIWPRLTAGCLGRAPRARLVFCLPTLPASAVKDIHCRPRRAARRVGQVFCLAGLYFAR